MPFYVYHRVSADSSQFERTGKHFSLAGYNILHGLWKNNDKPLNEGWHVTAQDMVEQWSGGDDTYETVRLIVDYDPKAKWRIAFAEPLDIYLYTHGDAATGKALWTVMMWRLKKVYYRTFESISLEEKWERTKQLEGLDYEGEDIMQFLYLHGDDKGWRWGATGRTNGAFIHEEAREYFREFF